MPATLIRYLDASNLVGCLISPDKRLDATTEYQCTGLEVVVDWDGCRKVHIRLEEIHPVAGQLTGQPLLLSSLDGYEVWQPLTHLPVAQPTWEDARGLVGQRVSNQHGVEFLCTSLAFDAASGRIWVNLDDINNEGEPVGTECGVINLTGLAFHGAPARIRR